MLRSEANRLRTHYIRLLKILAPNIAPTFNFGYQVKAENAQKAMRTFFSVAQRAVYGRDWAKQQDRPWPIAYGFFEHPDTNPHYHVLANVEHELATWIKYDGDEAWRGLVKRGQLCFREVYGPDGAWSYWTKRLASRQTFDDVWVYKDTRPSTVGISKLKVGKESGWL